MSSAPSRTRASARWLLPSLLFLTACGATPPAERIVVTQIERVVVRPGPAFVEPCADQPARRPVESQDDVALILLEVAVAGDDCRGRYRRLVDELEKLQ